MIKAMTLTGLVVAFGLLIWGCGKAEAKTTEIRIETAVCEMCVKTITATATEISGVQLVTADLSNKVVKVTYLVSKTNLAAIEDAIVKAGYAANDKPADLAAFENLPACCKIELKLP